MNVAISRWARLGLLASSLWVGAGCGAAQRADGGHGLLPEGHRVPPVSGLDQHGREVRLRRLEGQLLLVYFYPKDATPGCTKEACAFRDVWDRFQAAGVTVLGVSADSPQSHLEFAEAHGLPFTLVADPDHVWSDAFGVQTFMGMNERVSFLVDAGGRVARVYPDVDPGVHAEAVLRDVARLVQSTSSPQPAP